MSVGSILTMGYRLPCSICPGGEDLLNTHSRTLCNRPSVPGGSGPNTKNEKYIEIIQPLKRKFNSHTTAAVNMDKCVLHL